MTFRICSRLLVGVKIRDSIFRNLSIMLSFLIVCFSLVLCQTWAVSLQIRAFKHALISLFAGLQPGFGFKEQARKFNCGPAKG